jgi:hypothetical protein
MGVGKVVESVGMSVVIVGLEVEFVVSFGASQVAYSG